MRAPIQERREISVRGIVQGVGFGPLSTPWRGGTGSPGWSATTPRESTSRWRATPKAGPLPAQDRGRSPAARRRGGSLLASARGARRAGFPDPGEPGGRQATGARISGRRHLRRVPAGGLRPRDRRYRYPFTNCTNCGPRFTISRAVPYDRSTTTMSRFEMCPDAKASTTIPPTAASTPSPTPAPPADHGYGRWTGSATGARKPDDPILRTARMLRGRAIVAIKGLGGYHLACDPSTSER